MAGTRSVNISRWAPPVISGWPVPSRSMTPSRTGASRCLGSSSGRTRSAASGMVVVTAASAVQAGQRPLAVLARLAPHLPHVGDALEAGDLPLALEAGGVVGGEPADQRGDAVAQL